VKPAGSRTRSPTRETLSSLSSSALLDRSARTAKTAVCLRQLIREELLRMVDLPVEEKVDPDGSYYTLHVTHSKTFEFPGRDPVTVKDYEKSELRARVRDGVMEIVSIYVPENQRGKSLATQMVRRAAEWGDSKGYTVVGSGVYSSDGSGLAKSFIEKGLARADAQSGKHSYDPRRG
jgi:GNAT superfamily N-acetyltransferase